jgi:hypothetical protein
MKFELTDYRFGLIIGACGAWGLHALLEGLEILVFGGLVIPWNTQNAIIAVLSGLAFIGLAFHLHRWVVSITNVVEAETEVND